MRRDTGAKLIEAVSPTRNPQPRKRHIHTRKMFFKASTTTLLWSIMR